MHLDWPNTHTNTKTVLIIISSENKIEEVGKHSELYSFLNGQVEKYNTTSKHLFLIKICIRKKKTSTHNYSTKFEY